MIGVILAGGKGDRMSTSMGDDKCIKPLVGIAGKPMLGHIIERLSEYLPPNTPIIVVTGYGAEEVENYVNSIPLADRRIVCVKNENGTATALGAALEYCRNLCNDSTFFCQMGDHIFDRSILEQLLGENGYIDKIDYTNPAWIPAISPLTASKRQLQEGPFLLSTPHPEYTLLEIANDILSLHDRALPTWLPIFVEIGALLGKLDITLQMLRKGAVRDSYMLVDFYRQNLTYYPFRIALVNGRLVNVNTKEYLTEAKALLTSTHIYDNNK
ncbi:MAG: hypothetical protein DRN26_00120 [Thermoplasmata archaeon]|nr:MAG: hypothetical protein DRN26_00120 [Thermoplasmata archaeon]